MKTKLLVIVPAYNEEQVIAHTLKLLLKELSLLEKKFQIFTEVAVIDGGSKDKTRLKISKLPVTVLRHRINRGLGGALGTGIAYAHKTQPDVIVTFDSDGQHEPQDIYPLIHPIIEGQKDMVVGSRLLKNQKMRLDRKLLNMAANIFTYLIYQIKTTDSQSGLRAFSRKAYQKLNLKTNRMEVSTEFFLQAKQHKFRYGEIGIKPIYSEYDLSKGQDGVGNLNAINILIKLLFRSFRG